MHTFQRLLFSLLVLLTFQATAQVKTENVIVITTDGYRWQELFQGLDTVLAKDKKFNQSAEDYLYKKYWNEDPTISRSKILPFFWNTLAARGQVYGNRQYGSKVDVANPTFISFPGYSEMFTGFVDEKIFSNAFAINPNENVLQFINRQKKYQGKVAAFGGWAAFPYILNREASTFPIFAAYDSIGGRRPNPNENLINSMMQKSYKPFGDGVTLDVFTHHSALEYLKTKRPKVLYISYAETDEWAHAGQYKDYLDAAHNFDRFLEQIWKWVQQTPEYRNKTTLFITTDHGRGDKLKEKWTSHGSGIAESGQIWFAAIGPEIKPKGEIKTEGQIYQKQFAQTIASFLKLKFTTDHPVAEPVKQIFE
ncbi:MAG TPA: alkaline phosphatase family protein [Sphingobacteriaceae bacterium]